MSELDRSRSSRRRFLAGIVAGTGTSAAAAAVAYRVLRNAPNPQSTLGGTHVNAVPNPRLFSFVGGDRGSWRVTRIVPYIGEPLPDVARIDIVNRAVPAEGGWVLRGVTSNERYATRTEKTELAAKQVGLGRPTATHAALIAVRFQYEWHDTSGQWHCSYGNELWEFDEAGLMRRREASINDVMIPESDHKFFWPAPGPRPSDHPSIPDVR